MDILPQKRLASVTVKKLFGQFDHTVNLRLADRITIIHGPNGFGKTALLKMIQAFFDGNLETLKQIPFDELSLQFEDGARVQVVREIKPLDLETKTKRNRRIKEKVVLTVSYVDSNGLAEQPYTTNQRGPDGGLTHIYQPSNLLAEYSKLDEDTWVHDSTGEMLDKDELRYRIYQESPRAIAEFRNSLPTWLKQLRCSINIRLIEAQRLVTINQEEEIHDYVETRRSGFQSAVNSYAKQLSQHIQETLTIYASTSQKLDSSFPGRVLQTNSTIDIDQVLLAKKLKDLEFTRQRIISAGLLDKEDQTQLGLTQSFDNITKNILALYAEDVATKLGELNNLTNRIELFKKIVNQRFSYKQIIVDKDSGFYFISNNAQRLKPTDLSSGEQHELVLFYELLFKTDVGALILIDEPELSLHVSWQVLFLQDLANIVKLSAFDVILATHSPELINDRWDLTEALRGPDDGQGSNS